MSLNEVFESIDQKKDESINILSELLKIPSIAAKGTGIKEAIDFLRRIFREIGFNFLSQKRLETPFFVQN